MYFRVKEKEVDKFEKYQDLELEIIIMRKMKTGVLPAVVRALGAQYSLNHWLALLRVNQRRVNITADGRVWICEYIENSTVHQCSRWKAGICRPRCRDTTNDIAIENDNIKHQSVVCVKYHRVLVLCPAPKRTTDALEV